MDASVDLVRPKKKLYLNPLQSVVIFNMMMKLRLRKSNDKKVYPKRD